MEEYAGAELSLSQLVDELEKRLSLMMDRSCSDAILDEEEIDRVVSKLLSITANVYQLKNSLVPINRLPPELLALVPTFRESERDLINATAVCRHWRTTFVSTPNLWTNIVCSEKAKPEAIIPHVRTYLKRSGAVPVSVQIPAHASRLLSSSTGRISSLRMFLGHQSCFTEIVKYFSKPAPLLESMSLHVTNCGPTNLTLPPTLFEEILPSVKMLAIYGSTLSPGPYEFSQLTIFILETPTIFSVPSAALLDTLERIPLLQYFRARLYYTSQPDAVPGNRVVTLPHLKEIGIIADGQLLAPLTNPVLLALRLPSARRVKTRLVAAFNIPPTPILPLSFKERLPGLGATPEVSVTIDREFNIEFFGLGQSKLTLSIFSITGVLLTRTIFGDAPFGSVRKLQVCFPGPVTNLAPFVTILRATRGLEWLEMEQSIEEPLTHWAEADDQAEICPALTTLIVDITEVDADEAKDYVRWLEQARECAGVPIACVGIGYRQDWAPMGF